MGRDRGSKGRSGSGEDSRAWSSSLLTPPGTFSRAKVDSKDTRQRTVPWLSLPGTAWLCSLTAKHPFPNEETGLALLKGWCSSLGLLRNCAEKQVPVLLRAVVLGGETPRSLWQRLRCSSEKQGCVSREEGSMLPLSPLCPWKVLSQLLHSGTNSPEFSQMETICIGDSNCKISSGFSKEQGLGSSQGLLPTMHVPGYAQGQCGPLDPVPVLLNCALESGGHQQNILWLMRVGKSAAPEQGILDPKVSQKALFCGKRVLPLT